MRKKIYSVVMLIIAAMLIMSNAVFAVNPAIVDEAGYLTDEQLTRLSAALDDIRSVYNMDVAVYIEDTMSGYDAESTADDIFDYKGYGMGENRDGIMLYLSKNPRKYQYTTHGYGITVFNSRGLEYIDRRVLPYLQSDNYADAIAVYADISEQMLSMAAEGEPYNEKDGTTLLIVIGAVILIPIAIAWFLTGTKLKQMKTAVPENYANNYMKQGSMNLAQSNDIFLYSVVNRTEKPKSDTHMSSSGETHGGRGGSY